MPVLIIAAIILGSIIPMDLPILNAAPVADILHARYSDKLFHLTGYACAAFWFATHAKSAAQRRISLSALVGLGALAELLQGVLGYRGVEVADAVANAFGVMAGALAAPGGARSLLRQG
jgi:hypothetical protein